MPQGLSSAVVAAVDMMDNAVPTCPQRRQYAVYLIPFYFIGWYADVGTDSTLRGRLGASLRRPLKSSMVAIQQRCLFIWRPIGIWSSTSRQRRSLASEYLQSWSHKPTA